MAEIPSHSNESARQQILLASWLERADRVCLENRPMVEAFSEGYGEQSDIYPLVPEFGETSVELWTQLEKQDNAVEAQICLFRLQTAYRIAIQDFESSGESEVSATRAHNMMVSAEEYAHFFTVSYAAHQSKDATVSMEVFSMQNQNGSTLGRKLAVTEIIGEQIVERYVMLAVSRRHYEKPIYVFASDAICETVEIDEAWQVDDSTVSAGDAAKFDQLLDCIERV